MFTPIDFDRWERREIYEAFCGYTYCMTVPVDITRFQRARRRMGLRFYPALCHGIAKTVNRCADYRFARVEGRVGVFDRVNAHYTLMRSGAQGLFTHQITAYQEDLGAFCRDFARDRAEAESCARLYAYDGPPPLDTVHISIVPLAAFTSLSYSKPARFSGYDRESTSFIPFVTVGRFTERDGAVTLPVAVEFHHAVNDGFHAQRFFELLSETLNEELGG